MADVEVDPAVSGAAVVAADEVAVDPAVARLAVAAAAVDDLAAVDLVAVEPAVDGWLLQPAGGVLPTVHVVAAAKSSAVDFEASELED